MEPLWKFRKELDEWNTFTETRIRDYRKRIFEYLNYTFGVEEKRPNEGQKLERRGHKTVKVEETTNKFLDNLIKEVIRPGYEINDEMYDFYEAYFQSENTRWQDELRKIKNEASREEFNKKHSEYSKWQEHKFTKTIRPADVVIYKYKPESK